MEKTTKGHIDWIIFFVVLGLMLFSIAFVYSASQTLSYIRSGTSDKFFWNHALRIFLAIITMIIFAKIDYHIWKKYSKFLLFISVILLILIFFIGPEVNKVYRWIYLGPINFQPSEIAKFALVLHLATLITERQQVLKEFKYAILPMMTWTLVVCILIALQPNFSTAFVIYLIAVTMMFIGNVNFLHLISVSGVIFFGALGFALSSSYRLTRLLDYFRGSQSNNPEDINYQVNQAVTAFGNGGFFGVGPGNSQQQRFVPEPYGDFIYSIIGEEFGFIGSVLIILCFLILIYRGLKILKKAPDTYGYILGSGILLTFALYSFVSIAVNCGVIPTTGQPLPFISYGGTAVIFYAAAIGVFLNISAQSNRIVLKEET